MHYTQRLKDLREDSENKQETIAKELEMTRQQYQLYESGKRKLPIDKLIQLCNYYKVSADYILGFTNDPTPHWTVKNDNNNNNNKTVNIEQNGNSNKIGNINL